MERPNTVAGLIEKRRELVARLKLARDETRTLTCGIDAIDTHEQLLRHLADFINAYNFAKRLKTLKGLTPYEFICQRRQTEPQRFHANPHHHIPGLNI